MKNHRLGWTRVLVVPILLLIAGCATHQQDHAFGDADGAEQIRPIERARLRALVEADLGAARRLHADDFQLINPLGMPFTKEQYLSQISSSQLDYRAWEPGEIAVRLYGDVAVVRYLDVRYDVYFGGQLVSRTPMYHTNVYERRGGGDWQVVWSQASGVLTP